MKSYELNLLRNNRKLSDAELSRAKRICEEVLGAVTGRERYMRERKVDAKFALPDANWSYEAPNEFVSLFRRIARADAADLDRLRGFTHVFSGYNLYQVCKGRGTSSADARFDADIDLHLESRLVERNGEFIEKHRHQVAGLTREAVFRPPSMLGEVGHVVDGVLVNHDTIVYQERINILFRSGVINFIKKKIESCGEIRICEIGGGYGALCHWFKGAFPEASYTIVDLPESLLFSRLYVSLTRPEVRESFGLPEARFGVRFVPNYMAKELRDSFDLIVNTLSMSEMSEYQVRKYSELMYTTWLKEDGIFFEQNQDNRGSGLLFAQEILASEFEFRYPLYSDTVRYSQGFPNLWSLNPLDLESIREG